MSDHKRLSNVKSASAHRYHTKQRAMERFGIQLTDADIEAMVKAIQGGVSVCVKRDSKNHSLHQLNLNGTDVVVAYNKYTKTIGTVMYAKWFREGRR